MIQVLAEKTSRFAKDARGQEEQEEVDFRETNDSEYRLSRGLDQRPHVQAVASPVF